MPRPEKVRLGEILLQQQLLTEQQLQDALAEQKRSGRKLGRVFVEMGFVSEEQISMALAKQLQVPYVNLKHFTVKPEIAMRPGEVRVELHGIAEPGDRTVVLPHEQLRRAQRRLGDLVAGIQRHRPARGLVGGQDGWRR